LRIYMGLGFGLKLSKAIKKNFNSSFSSKL
jgi:hypothetical protein